MNVKALCCGAVMLGAAAMPTGASAQYYYGPHYGPPPHYSPGPFGPGSLWDHLFRGIPNVVGYGRNAYGYPGRSQVWCPPARVSRPRFHRTGPELGCRHEVKFERMADGRIHRLERCVDY